MNYLIRHTVWNIILRDNCGFFDLIFIWQRSPGGGIDIQSLHLFTIVSVTSFPVIIIGDEYNAIWFQPKLFNKTLIDKTTGQFKDLRDRRNLRDADLSDLKTEFRRQIDKVKKTGIKISHLDNHYP